MRKRWKDERMKEWKDGEMLHVVDAVVDVVSVVELMLMLLMC